MGWFSSKRKKKNSYIVFPPFYLDACTNFFLYWWSSHTHCFDGDRWPVKLLMFHLKIQHVGDILSRKMGYFRLVFQFLFFYKSLKENLRGNLMVTIFDLRDTLCNNIGFLIVIPQNINIKKMEGMRYYLRCKYDEKFDFMPSVCVL